MLWIPLAVDQRASSVVCLQMGSQCTMGSHTNTHPCAYIYSLCIHIHRQTVTPTNTHANTSTPVPLSAKPGWLGMGFFYIRAVLPHCPLVTLRQCNIQMCSKSLTSPSNTTDTSLIIIRIFRNVPAVPNSSVFVLFFISLLVVVVIWTWSCSLH